MAIMRKKVNIKTTVALRNFTPPLYGTYNGVYLTSGEILSCLCKRAIVDEVLDDGTLVRLNMSNYYTDNSHLMKKPTLDQPMNKTVVDTTKKATSKKAMAEKKVDEEVAPKMAEPVQKVEFVEQPEVKVDENNTTDSSVAETDNITTAEDIKIEDAKDVDSKLSSVDSSDYITSGYITTAEDVVPAEIESVTTNTSSDEVVVADVNTAAPKKRNYNKKK